jgi:hypothetical protein
MAGPSETPFTRADTVTGPASVASQHTIGDEEFVSVVTRGIERARVRAGGVVSTMRTAVERGSGDMFPAPSTPYTSITCRPSARPANATDETLLLPTPRHDSLSTRAHTATGASDPPTLYASDTFDDDTYAVDGDVYTTTGGSRSSTYVTRADTAALPAPSTAATTTDNTPSPRIDTFTHDDDGVTKSVTRDTLRVSTTEPFTVAVSVTSLASRAHTVRVSWVLL